MADRLIDRYRITNGEKFRLKTIDPDDDGPKGLKKEADERRAEGLAQLSRAQEKLYAQDQWGLLLVFQAMDGAGKDSTIRHVMSGVNPQGVQVYSFKAPSHEELDHDYLWRCARCLPERGRIGIFNRSYYEETLVVRVHPEFLKAQRIPAALSSKNIWSDRFEDINAWERYLTRNGIAIRKFFLHVSKEEQRQRFLSRLEEPKKNWKFSERDVEERKLWPQYMKAYEDMIRHTATEHAPWFVVPADHKWFMRLVVAEAVVDALDSLDLHFPKVDSARRIELEAARIALENEAKS